MVPTVARGPDANGKVRAPRPRFPESHYRLARIYRRLGLTTLAGEQTAAQQDAAKRQTDANNRRTSTITRFLVLLNQ